MDNLNKLMIDFGNAKFLEKLYNENECEGSFIFGLFFIFLAKVNFLLHFKI